MTTLAFDLDPVDEAVLELLGEITNLPIHIGRVEDSDDETRTVSAPLPYALYGAVLPYSTSLRLGGQRPDTTTIPVTYAHNSSRGVKAVASAVRDLLDGAVLVVGGKSVTVHLDSPGRPAVISRDDTWTRPGGLPLYFALDRYNVSI